MAGTKPKTDYYPGGMLMPGRSYSSTSYNFGYQGSLKDDEISGNGNTYNTFFRELELIISNYQYYNILMSLDYGLSPLWHKSRHLAVFMPSVRGFRACLSADRDLRGLSLEFAVTVLLSSFCCQHIKKRPNQ